MARTKSERREDRFAAVTARMESMGKNTSDRRNMLFEALKLIGANPEREGTKVITHDAYDDNHCRVRETRTRITGKASPTHLITLAHDAITRHEAFGIIKEPGDIDSMKIEICAARIMRYEFGAEWRDVVSRHMTEIEETAYKNNAAKGNAPKSSYRSVGKLSVCISNRTILVNAPIATKTWFKNRQITISERALPESLLSGLEGRGASALLDKPVYDGAFEDYVVESAKTIENTPTHNTVTKTTIILLKSRMMDINDDIPSRKENT